AGQPLLQCLPLAPCPGVCCAGPMDRSLPLRPQALHDSRRRRRQERLYVLLQTTGWLGFLGVNVFFSHFFQPNATGGINVDVVLASTRIVLIGWLLSHV